jgi:hypothetical protein
MYAIPEAGKGLHPPPPPPNNCHDTECISPFMLVWEICLLVLVIINTNSCYIINACKLEIYFSFFLRDTAIGVTKIII